jgi:hypothetical protein
VPVSAVDCVQPALQHTRDQLFRPFRFGQWSRLALVGFLAAELHTSGCNFSGFNLPNLKDHPRGQEFVATTPFPHIDPAQIAQLAGLIIAAAVLVIIVFFLFLYVSSVFRFILFDSVIKKHCSIGAGWTRWHRTGRRYFVWQLVFLIIYFLTLGVLIGVPLAVAAALGWFQNAGQHIVRSVLGVILLIGLFLVFLLLAAVVQVLAKDFLVPIMALDEVDFADGWSRLLALIRPEPGKFAVYLLLKIALAVAAAILFGILTILPILALVVPAALAVFAGYKAGLGWNVSTISLAIIGGTVLLALLLYLVALINVPATIFFPAFSIYFFASRYPKLDLLLNPPAPAPVLPPLLESPPPFEAPPLPPTPEPIG